MTLFRERSRPGLLGQAGWFVLIGSVSTVASLVLYWLLRTWLPAVAANLVAIAVTTVAGSELNRRVTFSCARAASARMLAQNVMTWLWAGFSTSLGLVLLSDLVTAPTVGQESAAMLTMSALGGLARYALLRYWVFVPTETRYARVTPQLESAAETDRSASHGSATTLSGLRGLSLVGRSGAPAEIAFTSGHLSPGSVQ